jgi:hypothetical protein
MSQPSCAVVSVKPNSATRFAARAARIWRMRASVALCVFALVFLSACAGGGHSGTGTTTDTIGGTVTGLTGAGLVLADNGGDNLPVTANGTFTFATPVSNGGAYVVTVVTQPTNPAETCIVTSGNGNATSNVTTIAVACAPSPTFK